MKKPVIAAAAFAAEFVAVAYSIRSLVLATGLMCLLVVPFGIAVALKGHAGTALAVAFAGWSVALAVLGDPDDWIFSGWLLTAYYECVLVTVVAAGLWTWHRVRATPVGARPQELLVERALSGEFDD